MCNSLLTLQGQVGRTACNFMWVFMNHFARNGGVLHLQTDTFASSADHSLYSIYDKRSSYFPHGSTCNLNRYCTSLSYIILVPPVHISNCSKNINLRYSLTGTFRIKNVTLPVIVNA